MPNVGLEFTTQRSRVTRSSDRVSQASWLGEILWRIRKCPDQWEAEEARRLLELRVEQEIAMHMNNVGGRYSLYKADSPCTIMANSSPVALGKLMSFKWEGGSHMTLSHSSRSSSNPSLLWSAAELPVETDWKLEARLIWREWLSSPSSALCCANY